MAKLSSFPRIIGGRSDGLVVHISQDSAAKIHNASINNPNDESAKQFISHEFQVAKQLFERQLRAPKPKGIEEIQLKGLSWNNQMLSGRFPAYLMEYVPGLNGDELRRQNIGLYWRAWNKYQNQIMRAKSAGFSPRDVNEFNFVYSPTNQHVYLIDFTRWDLTSI